MPNGAADAAGPADGATDGSADCGADGPADGAVGGWADGAADGAANGTADSGAADGAADGGTGTGVGWPDSEEWCADSESRSPGGETKDVEVDGAAIALGVDSNVVDVDAKAPGPGSTDGSENVNGVDIVVVRPSGRRSIAEVPNMCDA